MVEKRCGENKKINKKRGAENPSASWRIFKYSGNQKRQKSKSDPRRMRKTIPIYNIRRSDINEFQPVKKHNNCKKCRIDCQFFLHGLILPRAIDICQRFMLGILTEEI